MEPGNRRIEKPWRRWRVLATAGGVSLAIAAVASAQVRVVTWNLARLNGDPIAIEEVLATLAEDDRPGFAVAPAAMVFQEVTSGSLAEVESLVENAAAPGVEYVRAPYTSSPSEDGAGGAVALFYRPDLLMEVPSGHRDIATGAGRDSDRWQMRLVGYPESIGTLWIYGAHLKASNDAASREARLAGAEALRADMQSLPAGSRTMLVGDLNLYSNTEEAYLALLAPGAASLTDPLGSGSWSGGGNAIKHSQSPRDVSAGGLVGGAMDDRFDFQLVAASLVDGEGLDLIGGTYRSVGNDGNHFDVAINAGNNSYFPGEIARSNALADALFDASDHLPVAADLRLPGILVASVDDAIGRVIRGTPMPVEVRVSNNAPAETSFASLPIEVEVVAIDGATGTETVFAPLSPGIAAAEVWLDTSSAGEIEVLIEARASGQVANAVFPLQAIAEVVMPSRPSLAAKKPVSEISMSVEVPSSGVSTIAIAVHNLGYSSLQSLLEVDAVYGAEGAVSIASLPAAIGATAGEIVLSI
ncbi:MAG: endonuclease/exonuclease/phosphatase family protein, partial [Phycisphaerales bacterium]